MNWLVRREFWENRAIWIIPVAIGGFLILAALFGKVDMISIPLQMPSRTFGGAFFVAVGATYYAVMSIYSTWYLLDCLYADRRDRSVLFWKSMPISDTSTVISKLATASLVIPLVYFAVADATTLLIAFIVSVRASSAIGGALWHVDLWLQLQVLWIYVIVTSAVWYLPIAAYLLVISAWAKRAVMLWSILPPLAILLVERWFLGTHVFANLLLGRLFGAATVAFHTSPADSAWLNNMADDGNGAPQSIWRFLDAAGFFSSPQTWIGVAAGAILVVCAIQLRMRRTEI
jgi:ABC-2 type transport system permease protein